jgi:thioredoxin 1
MRVIKFSATWCGPCKALAKTLENVNTQIPIESIDIDENQETALEYGVRGVPTMIMLDENNNVIKRFVGAKSQTEIEAWLND